MAHFSLTDLRNRSGEVVDAASRGPVEIPRQGKRKFVLLTAEDYDRLARAADTRRALHADDAPDDVAAMMLRALQHSGLKAFLTAAPLGGIDLTRERAARPNVPKALAILKRAGVGNPPMKGDKLLRRKKRD